MSVNDVERAQREREREREQLKKDLDKDSRDALRNWMDSEGSAPTDIPAGSNLQKISGNQAERLEQDILRGVLNNSHEEMKRAMRRASGDE